MDTLTLEGYLEAAPSPGPGAGGGIVGPLAVFRLIYSPTDDVTDEALLPCATNDPHIAHALLADLHPGDQLRVSGHLVLPHDGVGPLRLSVDALCPIHGVPFQDPAPATPPEEALLAGELPEHGVIDRYGTYLAYHDPDTALTRLWEATGAWVGSTDDPARITTLIEAHERHRSSGES